MSLAKKEHHVSSSKSIGKKALEDLKKIALPLATKQWIDSNDELLDNAPESPVTLNDIFSKLLIHKSFTLANSNPTSFDWSEFRSALEMRNANSPRWFVQLREEDLLLGPNGLEGVRVDCFVVVEAKAPTFSPAEYIVKVHWPYSDSEDNAPERILSLAQQGMCWRRVVKNNGDNINVYILQKRRDNRSGDSSASSEATFGFGLTSSASSGNSSVSSLPERFSFGASAPAPPSRSELEKTASVSQVGPFNFGFGSSTSSENAVKPTAFSFGFPSTSPSPGGTGAINFGFGSAHSSSVSSSSSLAPSFSFGNGSTCASSVVEKDSPHVPLKQLSTSEVLFTLWSRSRLEEMKKEIQSGSRIVSGSFAVSPTITIKLVMQNDVEDDVHETAYRLILRDIFAKQNVEMKKINKWINDCPVYDEELANVLQEFRESRLKELGEESDDLKNLVKELQPRIEKELQRIILIRREAAQLDLDMIEFISERMNRKLLLEKKEFRLLKYYAKNDKLPFRPFGKISGICEMGETVDVCVPRAHVNVNPFTQNSGH